MLTSCQGRDTEGSPALTSEIKFLVPATVAVQIRDWARARLGPDPHGGGPHGDQYRVTSVYLDTAARDVFHRRGSYARSKYRVRRYEDERTAFLERKLRRGSRLAKRRTSISLTGLARLSDAISEHGMNGARPEEDPALWFCRRIALRRLQPVCQISYLRTARIGDTPNGSGRLTIDEQLVAVLASTFAFGAETGVALLEERAVLELKYAGLVPVVFKQLVEEFGLTPMPASKYRFAVQALGAVAMHA